MKMLAKIRLLILPIEKINQAIPSEGLIYEIGSGRGSLADNIACKFLDREVIGIDIDTDKNIQARQNYQRSNLTFITADALKYKFKPCRGVVFSDFLHHLPYSDQEIILKKTFAALKHQGVIVIKEIDINDGLLAMFSRLWDYLTYPQDKIYYRSKQELKKNLLSLGLNTKVSREVSWFPGSTHLFICQKK